MGKKNEDRYNSPIIKKILYNKEREGLRVQNLARIIVISCFLPMTIIFAESNFEREMSLITLIVIITVSFIFHLLIVKKIKIRLIGTIQAILDVAILTTLALIWYLSVGGATMNPSFLLKNLITLISILFIIINSQSLNPLYTIILTVGVILLHVVFFLYVSGSPVIEFTQSYAEGFTTSKLNPGIVFTKILILAAVGFFMTRLNINAQKTISSVASLERSNGQLGRFFSPNVAEKITQSEDSFTSVGGNIQNVAVLFTDIRDFTAHSEKLSPDEVLQFLSRYHEIMVEIIFKHNGTLDKFIGDSIMATFGTPVSHPKDCSNALNAAIEMNKALAVLNETRHTEGLFPIEHGVGIHYGLALVGNIGTKQRLEYTVIGDTVNSASRIEGACKKLKISLLFSSSLLPHISSTIKTKKLGSLKAKGKSDKIEIYTIDE